MEGISALDDGLNTLNPLECIDGTAIGSGDTFQAKACKGAEG